MNSNILKIMIVLLFLTATVSTVSAWVFTQPTAPVLNYVSGFQMGNTSLDASNIYVDEYRSSLGSGIRLNATKVNITQDDASLKLYAKEHTLFGNNNGESIELRARDNDSKPYIGWYGYDGASDSYRGVGWFGCHYWSNTDLSNQRHSHCSIETLDNSSGTPLINTKFEISYGSEEDHAQIEFPNSAVHNMKITDMGVSFYNNTGTKLWSNGNDGLDMRLSVNGSSLLQFEPTKITANQKIIANDAGGITFGASLLDKLWRNANGDLRISTGGSSRVAITNASTTILNTLTLSTTKPSAGLLTGMIYFNTTTNTTNCYTGSSWVYCGNGTVIT